MLSFQVTPIEPDYIWSVVVPYWFMSEDVVQNISSTVQDGYLFRNIIFYSI